MKTEQGTEMEPIKGEVLPPDGQSAAGALTISKDLKDWIQESVFQTGWNEAGRLLQGELKPTTAVYWKVADRGDTFALAGRLLQGYALEKIHAADPEGFAKGVKARGWAQSTAFDRIAIYRLFNKFGDMGMVSRATQLSDMRIRLLLPEIKDEGIVELVVHGESQGLKFKDVVGMSAAEIRKTRAERRAEWERQQLENAAAQGEPVPDYTPTAPDPRWIVMLREEAMTLAWRARAELAALAQVCESLASARPVKEQRGPRVEMGSIVHSELQNVQLDAQNILDALQKQFGDALDAPHAESRGVTQFKTQHDRVLAVLEVETTQRLSVRHKRHGWRGRPAATFKAALDGALKADEKDEAE